jgi:putative ABC transport system permease protein
MLKSTFITFFRSFTRHPLYALLNLLGLSFGIAVLITLSLFFRFETTFEQWVPNVDKLYTVQNSWNFSGQFTAPEEGVSGQLLTDLQTDYPDLVGTRLWDQDVTVHSGAQSNRENEMVVDGNFFSVFDIPLVAGSKSTALSSPNAVMITQSLASKYFPGQKPAILIGRTMRLTDDEDTHDYRISAVLADIPANSQLSADKGRSRMDVIRLLTPQHTDLISNWKNYGSQRLLTILKMTPERAARFNTDMPAFLDLHASAGFAPDVPHTILHVKAFPFKDVHLQNEKTRSSVYVLALVGMLAFLIAAINYINLATARAGMRAREVAVRKTLGATQGQLRTQFLGETVLVTLAAMLVGLSLVELSLPFINSFGGLTLKMDYLRDGLTLGAIGGFVMAVGFLAGLYPAFVLAGFKPAQVLAASRTPAGGRWAIRTREALVVLQFAVVIAFFIMITGFFSQIRHMKDADLGFSREGVLITSSTFDSAVTDAQREAVWAALRALPGAVAVTAGNGAPGDSSQTNNTLASVPGFVGTREPSVSYVFTGRDYFKTYGGRLIAGRDFDPNRADDEYIDGDARKPGQISNVVANRSAVILLGLKSPDAAIGQLLNFDDAQVRIIGVVEDMRFRSPKHKVASTLYVHYAHPHRHAITGLRYSGVSEPVMRARMQTVWRQIAPNVPFDTTSVAENIDRYYKPDRNRTNLFSTGAGIAALIGCIGLYGMAAFNTSRRMREVGLRKVLGASRGQVTRLLVGQFLRPVLIANLFAWPAAYFALKNWLSQFDDPIALNVGYFVVASLVALLIALLTVAGLAMASASTEPGRALRHD